MYVARQWSGDEAPFRTAARCSPMPLSDSDTRSRSVDFQALVPRCTNSCYSLSSEFRRVPSVYADAYFKLGDTRNRVSDFLNNKSAIKKPSFSELENGFGVLLFPVRGPPKFFFGCMPGSVLKVFASRGAFIFILEPMAQILAWFACRQELCGCLHVFRGQHG